MEREAQILAAVGGSEPADAALDLAGLFEDGRAARNGGGFVTRLDRRHAKRQVVIGRADARNEGTCLG